MDRDDQILAYLQGRMEPTALAAFEQEIARDPNLAAEVVALRTAQAVMSEAAPVGADAAWARLSAAIETDSLVPANNNSRPRLLLLQAAAIAVAAVCVWQFALQPLLPGSEDGYVAATATESGPVLQVQFVPTARLGEVSTLLYDLTATITSGPSALGVYTVSFPDADSRDAAMTALGQMDGLVSKVLIP